MYCILGGIRGVPGAFRSVLRVSEYFRRVVEVPGAFPEVFQAISKVLHGISEVFGRFQVSSRDA